MSTTTKTLDKTPGNHGALSPFPSKRSQHSTTEASLECLRQYFDSVPFIRFVVDTSGKITLVNRAGCDTLGCRSEEVTGLNWMEKFIPSDQRSHIQGIFEKLLTGGTGTSEKYKTQSRTENGETRTIEWFHVPLKDSSGNIVGIVCSGEDVTILVNSEDIVRKPLEMARAVFEKVPVGIFVVGKDKIIRDINKAALDIVGRKREEIVGRKCDQTMCLREDGKCPVLDLGEDLINSERSVLDSGGNPIPILKTIIPTTLEGEEVLLEAFLDITERKQAEEKQKQLTCNLNERVKELKCMYGIAEAVRTRYTLKEIFQDVAEFVPPSCHYPEITRGKVVFDRKEYISEPFTETAWKLSSDIVVNGEARGALEVYYLEERPETDEDPFMKEEQHLIDGVAQVLSDAASKFNAERLVRESEEKFRVISASANDAIVMIDNDGNISFWNNAAEVTFELSADEVIGRNFHELFAPEKYHDQHKKAFIEFQNTGEGAAIGKTIELTACRKDGTEFPVELSLSHVMLNEKWNAIGIVRDISERRKFDGMLRENEEKFRTLFESSSDAVMLLDEKGFFDCNSAALKMFGCKNHEEFCSYHLADLSPPNQPDGTDSMTLARKYMGNAIEEGSTNFDWVHQRTNGETFFAEVLLNRMTLKGSQVMQAVVRDISERIKREEEFARTVSEYMAMINAVPAMVFLKDIDRRYLIANEAFCSSLGLRLNEIIGKTASDLFEDQEVAAQNELEIQVIHEDRIISRQDERTVGADGQEKWVSTTIVPLHDSQGLVVGVVGLTQDVSELHQSREKLVQADKMAAIGTLSAGVAHEINNPVGFINSNLNTMGKYLKKIQSCLDQDSKPDAETRESLTEMLDDFADAIEESLDGTNRVKKIVADLKSFSRVDKSQKGSYSLTEGLETTLNIVWNELKYKCTVEKEYGEIPELYCIPNQLNQVFMNLLVNAGHAIQDDSGTITIATRADKQNIYISISDTGAGIPPENLKRIFEPFFTTKDVGKGTGLGLSMAYDIIKKHLGQIDVISEVGSGTKFTITLPLEGLRSSETQSIVG